MYIPAKDIDAYHQKNKGEKLNFSGQDERELDAALKKSLQQEEGKKEEEEEPKFKAFTGKGVSLSEPSTGPDT